MQRRDESIESLKARMENLTKSLPYYAEMRTYSYLLSGELYRGEDLGKDLINAELCLYYISNLLRLTFDYMRNIGTWQLGNLQAEKILADCYFYLLTTVTIELSFPDVNKIINLVDSTTTYDQFYKNLLQDCVYHKKLKRWLLEITDTEKLEQRCRWFYELNKVEVDHSYSSWYGEEPDIKDLSEDTVEYIKKDYPRYYARLLSFERGHWYNRIRQYYTDLISKMKDKSQKKTS
jgi:hypothetical protein